MGPVNKNYVKFVRGSKAAYDALPAKSPETLYFIYESAEADSGQLYLGEKLILGGSVEQITSLKDVADIAIGEDLANKDLLVYNSKTKKWENVTFDYLASEYIQTTPGDGALIKSEDAITVDELPDENGVEIKAEITDNKHNTVRGKTQIIGSTTISVSKNTKGQIQIKPIETYTPQVINESEDKSKIKVITAIETDGYGNIKDNSIKTKMISAIPISEFKQTIKAQDNTAVVSSAITDGDSNVYNSSFDISSNSLTVSEKEKANDEDNNGVLIDFAWGEF